MTDEESEKNENDPQPETEKGNSDNEAREEIHSAPQNEEEQSEQDTYSILLKEDEKIPVGKVADPLTAILGVPMAQARMEAKKKRGIFMESMPEDQANKLKQVLNKLGYESIILPDEEVFELPSTRELRQVWPDEESLYIQVGFRSDQFIPLPWEKVDYISAGVVGTQEYWAKTRDQSAKNLPMIHMMEDEELKEELRDTISEQGLEKDETAQEEPDETPEELVVEDLSETEKSDTIWIIDIICNSIPIRYRLKKDEMIFTYLAEKGVTSRSSEENFLHVLTDLLFQIDDIACTPLTARLHFGEPFQELIFEDMEHFDYYTRWFFTMYEHGHQELPELIPTLDGLDDE